MPDGATVTRPPDEDGDRTAHRTPDDGTAAYQPEAARTSGPSAGAASQIGQVIAGRYTVVREIGEGGMGSVYLATQSEPVKRRVALKLIRAGLDSKAVLARFDAERQALAVMDHPNIARVYDGGTTEGGQPFFVMELVNGQPLTDYCDQHRLTVDARLHLFVQVCRAVQHAHQKGVIHRDLKPGNVLVTEVDGRPTPKVIDFGVAKATEHALTDLSLDDAGAIVGTPAYMSPEQADPTAADIDTRTDVYALGVILYELLTGGPPIDAKQFKRGALLEILRMVREVEPPRPSTRLSTTDALPAIAANRNTEPARLARLLQGELDWVVMKAIEKDRTRRYDTANGLAQDVERYLADEVVEARPPSAGYRLRKFVARHRLQVIATAVVFLALVGGVIGTGIGLVQAEDARRVAEGLAGRNAVLAEDERRAKEQATDLAVRNGELAADEKKAKEEATGLAVRNGELAAAEKQAKEQVGTQLRRTKAVLFTSQMERVGAVLEQDPTAALELLHDADACPPDLRDLAWALAEKSAKRREYATFPAPVGAVQALSPDGKLLAVAELTRTPGRPPTGKVTVVEVGSGKVRCALPAFPDSVELLAFTPDGTRLAVVADGQLRRLTSDGFGEPVPSVVPGQVQLWEVDGPKLATTFAGHKDRITSLSFAADGTLLATGSLDKTARLWDVAAGQAVHTFEGHAKEVAAVALRPDGKRLATGGLDNVIKMWDVEGKKLLDTWTPAANPDPELAVSRRQDDQTQVFSQGPTYLYERSSDAVSALDFSADGTALVSANTNRQIEVRDAATGQVRATVRGEKGCVWWVRFHRDGKSVFGFQRRDWRVVRWDTDTGRRLFTLPVTNAFAATAVYAKASGLLAANSGQQCVVYDPDATPELATLTVPKATGQRGVPAFAAGGQVLAVGCGADIHLWDVTTGELRHTLKGHTNLVQCLAVSPDGNTLASSSVAFFGPDGTKPPADAVRLWDVTTGKPAGELKVSDPFVPSVAFSPDGTRLAALQVGSRGLGEFQPVVSVWEVKDRKQVFSADQPDVGFSGYANHAGAVAFNPADGTLVSAAGQSMCVWDLKAPKPVRVVRVGQEALPTGGMPNEFVGLAVRPDGKAVYTANVSGAFNSPSRDLMVWDPADGQLLKTVRNAGGMAMLFGRDGRTLVSAWNNTLNVLDTVSLLVRGTLTPHARLGQVGVALSPDGQTLATAFQPTDSLWDPTPVQTTLEVKLWDVGRSPTVLAFPGRNPPQVDFLPDGKHLAETDRSLGRVRVWDLTTGRQTAAVDTTQQSLDVISPDGRYMAGVNVAGPLDNRFLANIRTPETNLLKLTALLNLWDSRANTLRQFEACNGVVSSLQFSPDGRRIALAVDTSVGDGKVLRISSAVVIWNVERGRAEATVPFPDTTPAGRPVFSPDGNTVAFLTGAGAPPRQRVQVLLVDVPAGKALPPIDLKEGVSSRLAVRFTPDGTRLVLRRGIGTGTRAMWDWKTGEESKDPIPDVFGDRTVSADGRYQIRVTQAGVEVIDRMVKPPAVVSHRRRP